MLAQLLNRDALREFAGERAFERGAEYFADGHVLGLKKDHGAIQARVRGTYYYRVRLWAEAEELASQCNCPVGRDGVFCKHCVAVGLAWLDQRIQTGGAKRRQTTRGLSDEQIRAHLVAQDKGSLVELLMRNAEWDSDFCDRLVLATAQRGGKAPDLRALRASIDKAIRTAGSVDYWRMPEYARGIETIVDSLHDLLKNGHANEVRELTERALKQMESAMNHVDDSDGFMGGILEDVQELDLSACRAARPDPRALSKFLFDWEIASGWEIFLGAADIYGDVLGKAGLAKYRRLAEAKWAKVPALAPGEQDPERYHGRWRITHIMETLARQTGEVDALTAVKSRDLSEAFSFLEIAQIYKAAGNEDFALEWAERGIRAFQVHTDGRLRNFLIDEYHRRGRHGEATAIAWTSFRERPGLHAYQGLHSSAFRVKQWPQWREKALALLQEGIKGETKWETTSNWGPPVREDHSDLVEIYLWEGDSETAWTEAKNGGCHGALWFRLAEACEQDHPEDAIAVYTEQLKPALQWALPSAYEQVADILRQIRKLMVRIGKQGEFVSLIQSVRSQYKLRRNLMKLLDSQGW